jgi:integrase
MATATKERKNTKKSQEVKDVQPIRTEQGLKDMKWALKRHCSERDYILFLLGINTGLRISDLLKIKINDVKGKTSTKVKEGKTGKSRMVNVKNIYDELNAYINTLTGTEWLFPSRKGDKPITRVQAYRQLNKAADFAGVEAVGTHTMRKTFGYWYYKKTKDIVKLMTIFNHSDPQETLGYIGVIQEEIDESLDDFVL